MSENCRNKLFLITGPSGVGKSTLSERIIAQVPEIVFLQKAVTRPEKDGDKPHDEVVLFKVPDFKSKVEDGSIAVAYEKYGSWYGLFSSSFNGTRGLDALKSSFCLTIGDAMESPAEIILAYPETVVIVLYADLPVIKRRILEKGLPEDMEKLRIATIRKEFENGFPRNLKHCDYLISTERPINKVEMELIDIIEKEMRA